MAVWADGSGGLVGVGGGGEGEADVHVAKDEAGFVQRWLSVVCGIIYFSILGTIHPAKNFLIRKRNKSLNSFDECIRDLLRS